MPNRKYTFQLESFEFSIVSFSEPIIKPANKSQPTNFRKMEWSEGIKHEMQEQ